MKKGLVARYKLVGQIMLGVLVSAWILNHPTFAEFSTVTNVPFFKNLILKKSGYFPITDPKMTRFWITIEQGVEFVLTSLSMMQGGEILIPKIPSMKVADLARAMEPSYKHKIVGIRPGEKLHETMITIDDARSTYELEDRYIVQPQFNFWKSETYIEAGAVPVPDNFQYSSDTNSEWLDESAILSVISE